MVQMIALNVDKAAYGEWLKVRGKRDQQSSLHYLLDSTFGPSAIKPFRAYPGTGDTFQVIGYTSQDEEALKQISQLVACPDSLSVIDMGSLRIKTMPDLERDQVIGFDLKTIPVRRSHVSTEVDAYELDLRNGVFQRDAETAGTDRLTSYMTWLSQRLEGFAELDTELTAITVTENVPRQRNEIRYNNEIQVTGNMKVLDPKAFKDRLLSGVGRHKSYGYGMIVLRAPQLNHRIKNAS